MNLFRFLAVSCVALAFALGAHAADEAPAKKPAAKPPAKASAKGAEKKKAAAKATPVPVIKRPATPEEMLRNIKALLEAHLLLDEQFYEEKTLQRYFGGENAQWFKLPRPILKNGKLRDFSGVFAQDGEAKARAMDIMFKIVTQGATQKRRALIGMELGADPRASAQAVIDVFGRDGRVADPDQVADSARPRNTMPSTHPLGNKLLTYEFDGPHSRALANFLVNGDGSLANFMLVEEDKSYTLAPVTAVPPGASVAPK